jgi:hypothetical protein
MVSVYCIQVSSAVLLCEERRTCHEIIAVLESDGTIEIGEEDELGVLEGETQGFEVGGSHCE